MRGQILDMSAAYNAAMQENWDPLRVFYKDNASKPVTLVFDTVLHIVAHSKQPELMKNLIQVSKEALDKQNNEGNTVLFEAATSGDVKMAEVVLEANKEMLKICNMRGETPLFGASAFGQTEMVRFLASKGEGLSLRRKDGTSILHVAILGQYHDTALELLKLYPSLDSSRDEMGLTGLHLLASMPFTFRSGCHMGFPKKLIYFCIPTVETDAAVAIGGGNRGDVESGLARARPCSPSNYITRFFRGALHRINVKVWDCLSNGWPAVGKVCEEKKKHANVLQLVKKLAAKDMSWMESHNGGDPNKIRVFNRGKTPHEIDDANPNPPPAPALMIPGQSTIMTRNGALPHPPNPPKVIDGGPQLPSEPPLMATLDVSIQPPSMATHDDSSEIPSKFPPMVSSNGTPQPKVTDGGLQLPLEPPLLATHDDTIQPRSIVTHDYSTQFPSKLPPMVSSNDTLQSKVTDGGLQLPSEPPLMATHDDSTQPTSMATHDDNTQFPSNLPPMVSSIDTPQPKMTDGGLQLPSEPPLMATHDDSTQLISKHPFMATHDDNAQVFSKPPPMVSSNDSPHNGSLQQPTNPPPSHGIQTPLLMAAERGIVEIVVEILDVFPQAVEYVNDEGCNILHVAVQYRQTMIFGLVCNRDTIPLIRLNRRLDVKGNSVLHHAAKRNEKDPRVDHLRNIPGEALQMQWEIQWFKQVKEVVPPHYRNHLNEDGEKAEELFTKCHKELAKNGEKWLMRTANSCSLVATLIATVAFTSAYTVPGGPNQNTGHPVLLDHPAFLLFTVSDTISLSFALTSVVVFLSIMTSRFHEQDFHLTLPLMLVIGLTSLFLAVSAMMFSFGATLVLMITQKLRRAAIPIYLVACFPVTIFLLLQFPLYVRVAWYTIGDILNKFQRSFSSRRRGLKQD